MRAVKRLRLEKGWSQKDLADKSGVGQDTISGVESGKHEPRPSTLRKLAEALDTEVSDLFSEELTTRPKVEPLSDDLVEESKAVAERKRWNEREWWKEIQDLDDFELQRRAEELGNEALRWVGEDPKRWEQAAQRHFVVRLLLKIRADTATENEKRQLQRLVPA